MRSEDVSRERQLAKQSPFCLLRYRDILYVGRHKGHVPRQCALKVRAKYGGCFRSFNEKRMNTVGEAGCLSVFVTGS
jgi:hypothetical protein